MHETFFLMQLCYSKSSQRMVKDMLKRFQIYMFFFYKHSAYKHI